MIPTRTDVMAMIRVHLASEFAVPPESITELTDIRRDLDVESIDVHALEHAIETTFRVPISFRADRVATVGDAVESVMELLRRADR